VLQIGGTKMKKVMMALMVLAFVFCTPLAMADSDTEQKYELKVEIIWNAVDQKELLKLMDTLMDNHEDACKLKLKVTANKGSMVGAVNGSGIYYFDTSDGTTITGWTDSDN